MIEKLSFTCVRQLNSSIAGCRKNGAPKRNVVAKPIAVSAGTLDATASRGRSSRVYEKCASFTIVDETVEKRLTFTLLILDGPSIPFAELPYVATSKVWLVFFE